MKTDKTKVNVQRATKQTHTATHAVGIFQPLKGPVHGYHNMSVTHATMTLYRTIKIDRSFSLSAQQKNSKKVK